MKKMKSESWLGRKIVDLSRKERLNLRELERESVKMILSAIGKIQSLSKSEEKLA